ncbi:MAG TPA: alpha-L-fucosidase [Lentisphaeria bacterium]|nr:MAG: alpha-L-fucosidase [Lentisphaerae bacterium GWF2_49_21]HBC86558.1 alpha-L-fucosidase [Lentisphaeria bacterium]
MAAKTAAASKSRTTWFTNDRFGMFIHWGLYSMPARHEWVRNRERITNEQYEKYFERFNPDLYDPKEWAKMAKAAGMKYFVITTKHHEGFCLWDSKYTDYKATKTPCRKDLLKAMVDAFRAEGLKVGFYYSLLDWHHPDFPIDKIHPQRDDKAFREKEKKRDVRKYAEYMRNQVTELLTKFGKIDILWFDFSYPGEDGKGHKDWESEKLLKLVRKLQPDIMIDNRLDLPGSGDFETPEQFQPAEGLKDKEGNPVVWEACQTFSGSWGYHRDEMSWREPEELITTLIDCVSKSGNLLLNVGPTARGEFDYRAQERLAKFAEWMKRHDRSIYGCQQAPAEFKCPKGCSLTYNPETRRLYLHILVWPYKHITMEGKAFTSQVEYAQFLHDGSEVAMKGLEEWQSAHKLGGENSLSITLPQMKPNVIVPVVELFLKK